MNLEYKQIIPEGFNNSAKVWIYQSNRLLGIAEALQLEMMLNDFVSAWESHGAAVKGYANLLFGQFIVFMADDSEAKICGRSIDSVTRFVQEIEKHLSLSLMDRHALAFVVKDKIQLLPLSQLKYSVENGFITPETLYFNNMVTDKQSLLSNWLIPVKDSWLAARIPALQHS